MDRLPLRKIKQYHCERLQAWHRGQCATKEVNSVVQPSMAKDARWCDRGSTDRLVAGVGDEQGANQGRAGKFQGPVQSFKRGP